MEARWKQSSSSEGANNCVEVAHHLDAARDSKNPMVALQVDVSRLLDAVKADRLTR